MDVVSSYFKQPPSNFNLDLYLFYCSFGEKKLFVVEGGLNFPSDSPLDSHSENMFGPEKVAIVL